MDLIDRHLIAGLVDAHGNVHWEDIVNLPTAEPKKGKCKEVYDCEMCDFYMTEDSLFVCPKSSNCGADMKGEE